MSVAIYALSLWLLSRGRAKRTETAYPGRKKQRGSGSTAGRRASRRARAIPSPPVGSWLGARLAARDAAQSGDSGTLLLMSITLMGAGIIWFYPGLVAGWVIESVLSAVGLPIAAAIGRAVWALSIVGTLWFLFRAGLAGAGARLRIGVLDDGVVCIGALLLGTWLAH